MPKKTLSVEFPAFNVDNQGFPLTPMLLEVRFKDTINFKSYAKNANISSHRAFVISNIYYMSDDTLVDRADKINYSILSLDENRDYQWKYKQYGFGKSQFQLIRAIDG